MDYAIIEAGGKQHRVTSGERLRVDLMKGRTSGDEITFDNVYMVRNGDDVKIGTPRVDGARVEARVVANGAEGDGEKDKKLLIFKRRRRKGYSRRQGHRQRYTEVEILQIHA